jgi:hypothetical protein
MQFRKELKNQEEESSDANLPVENTDPGLLFKLFLARGASLDFIIIIILDGSSGEGLQEPESFWAYQQDPDTNTHALTMCTADLISWAFQIARGMDYLTSRKVSLLKKRKKQVYGNT